MNVRNGFFALLGSLQGFPYNAQVASGFTATIVVMDEATDSPLAGVGVAVYFAPQTQTGQTTNLPYVASGTGTTDDTGTAAISVQGAFNVSYQYDLQVVLSYGSFPAITFDYGLQLGGTVYQSGFAATIPVATAITVSGTISVDNSTGSGPTTAEGGTAVLQLDFSGNASAYGSASPTATGTATIGEGGAYSITIANLFYIAQAEYSIGWTLSVRGWTAVSWSGVFGGAGAADGITINETAYFYEGSGGVTTTSQEQATTQAKQGASHHQRSE